MAKFNEHVSSTGGDWLRLKPGKNIIRIVSEFEALERHYDPETKKSVICIGKENGCPMCQKADEIAQQIAELQKKPEETQDLEAIEELQMKFNQIRSRVQFLTWAIDRADGLVKLFQYGYTIQDKIANLSKSEEYGFDSVPPYDITITKEGQGRDTSYDVIAARKDKALTEEEEAKVKEKIKPIATIIEKMKAKVTPAEREEQEEEIPVIDVGDEEEHDGVNVKDIPF